MLYLASPHIESCIEFFLILPRHNDSSVMLLSAKKDGTHIANILLLIHVYCLLLTVLVSGC